MAKKDSVKPDDISLKSRGHLVPIFMGFFGNHSMEVVAYLIVKYLVTLGDWKPFSFRSIWRAGKEENPPEIEDTIITGWEKLLNIGWIVHHKEELYKVTEAFIKRCLSIRRMEAFS